VHVDVAVIGGGLAGGTLARQLRRRLPGASIAVFERDADGGFKVGESTVEIASTYLRRLGLQTYLYQEHLPKNGLRFFFDDAARGAELHRLGEIGGDALPFHPSFQVDRQRLDADLRAMNLAAGVGVQVGARVKDLRIGSAGEAHRFVVDDGASEREWSARWLVDASGRARVLAKTLGFRRVDTGHQLAAAWGRVRDFVDMDDVGPQSWRARARGTSRFLSTNHFMYPGYWIWFIPLSRGVMSIGVVIEKRLFDDAWRSPAGLLAFCREHRAPASLLEGVTTLDAMGYGNVAYGPDRFFSGDRWALVGEAAAFTDPLYSPGSDFIALENDFVTDLVARDLGGASASELAAKAALYEEFVKFRFDATILLYRDLYPLLGSYELFRIKWDFDIHCYYNLWTHAYMLEQHLDESWLRQQVGMRDGVLGLMECFSRMFRAAEREVRARGDYHRGNLDVFAHPLAAVDFAEQIGRPRTRKNVLRATTAICNQVFARAQALIEPGCAAPSPQPLWAFMAPRD
jgi:flavin-dependent dehydrogenase